MGLLDIFSISWTFLIFLILTPFVVKHRKILWITLWTLKRDTRLAYRAAHVFLGLKWDGWNNLTAGKALERSVTKCPDKICFFCGDEEWTFRQVNDLSNKIANYFVAKGFKKGDVVALYMDNRPEYPCIWLGLSKIGVVTALINYNLRTDSLRHCVKVASARALIYGTGFAEAVQEVMTEGGFKDIDLFSFDEGSTPFLSAATNLGSELKSVSTSKPKTKESVGFNDKLCYVYTSGTTGLPKAAVIKHNRFAMSARVIHDMNGCRGDDTFMTPLPLYHLAGGVMGVSQAVAYTTSVVIIKKFSASRFFTDCIRYKVTVTQYLGELCRFLLSQPVRPEDKQHQLRLVMGNGLRAEIWNEFVTRFNIPLLVEFYGSTEGNCGLSNIIGKEGACGFLPRILLPIMPMSLIRVDEFTGEPIRDPQTGLGIPCQPHETGELMAAISGSSPLREFPGYTDSASSNKKIVKDVFSKGDSCFRTGDVMIMDDYGYMYFRDRTGDTFRWKGENVSTMEVESVINRFCDMKDVAVYGVQIPGTDGRAGMAAIADPEGSIDWTKLEAGIVKSLPAYARPVFIRVLTTNVELTGTYKLRKVDLQKEEIDLSKIKDKVYILQAGKYVPMTTEIHAKVMSGQLRL